MAIWQEILIHIAVTAVTVLVVLTGFHRFVLRPYLDRKVEELNAAGDRVEQRVRQGVREGVKDGLMELPESTFKESTRTFLKFGSGLVENGLSSFLGTFDDPERRESRPDSTRNGQR
ncbi:hypothetical protein EZI54_13020 [Marinobacter halodurans]|uniref:Uncharacterized protein n=1 Tax=Marinobacter halodurans TaxID=2528979 RepID=A0ABY1ZN02_9GAMM|nr:hypothetical protein [Marinobacter halodurans]TBW54786.1 hypothetical protein EZI54_13020 [Marinobacter halodurans]